MDEQNPALRKAAYSEMSETRLAISPMTTGELIPVAKTRYYVAIVGALSRDLGPPAFYRISVGAIGSRTKEP